MAREASTTDVVVVLTCSAIGYVMLRYGYSTAAAAITVVLAQRLETNLRQRLLLMNSDWITFLTRPWMAGGHHRIEVDPAAGRYWKGPPMSRSIELHDREEYKRSMRELLTIDPTKTVALTVDMQRDYLDPSIATAPVRDDVAEKVVADTAAMLDLCRESGIPVVHCYVSRRPEEAALGGHQAPYTAAGQRAGLSQNLIAAARTRVDRVAGSGNEQVMPALVRDGDFMMGNKREMDSFHLTDLEMILRRYLKPELLLIAGINTDTCVYATTFGASVRGFRPVLIEECVASMRGADHHQMALELIAGSVAWVLSTAELRAKLAAAAADESEAQLSGV